MQVYSCGHCDKMAQQFFFFKFGDIYSQNVLSAKMDVRFVLKIVNNSKDPFLLTLAFKQLAERGQGK